MTTWAKIFLRSPGKCQIANGNALKREPQASCHLLRGLQHSWAQLGTSLEQLFDLRRGDGSAECLLQFRVQGGNVAVRTDTPVD